MGLLNLLNRINVNIQRIFTPNSYLFVSNEKEFTSEKFIKWKRSGKITKIPKQASDIDKLRGTHVMYVPKRWKFLIKIIKQKYFPMPRINITDEFETGLKASEFDCMHCRNRHNVERKASVFVYDARALCGSHAIKYILELIPKLREEQKLEALELQVLKEIELEQQELLQFI